MVENIAMDAVVSDMFGVNSKRVLDCLLTAKPFDSEYCLSLLHGRMKKNGEALIESFEGYSFTKE